MSNLKHLQQKRRSFGIKLTGHKEGMSTRHLITRVREHLDFNSIQRSAIKDHILSCDICSDVQYGLMSASAIIKCQIRVSYQNTRSFID